ncbi:zinc finger and BTB domain-containing protein 7B-like [Anopheles ziemanni]|uniref:zinc finger and BTB domain-containing protein 7B-like n=1 Tax=Anopheles ziemanni TaxID=345580 RepID=UPI00265DBFD4|nr:zinc finger and BTB domain-containing protein 7B-like [Anopheles ziemanni]
MAATIENLATVCRFCFCKSGLISLSEALRTTVAVEDVLHSTGIKISENEELPYAVCHACCKIIRNSVSFRNTCLKNDIILKKVLSVIDVDKSTSKPFQCTAPKRGNLVENAAESNIETITLDESDSDDSLPSLYGEAMQEAWNANTSTAQSEEWLISSTIEKEPDHPLIAVCEENENNASNSVVDLDVSGNPISNDDNDSDSAIPSLNGESKVPPTKNDSFTKDANEDKVQCHLCGTFQRYFIQHLKRVHQKKNRFSCPYCPKQMLERYILKEHINTWHKKDIMYTCERCGKGYTNYSGYFYHIVCIHIVSVLCRNRTHISKISAKLAWKA